MQFSPKTCGRAFTGILAGFRGLSGVRPAFGNTGAQGVRACTDFCDLRTRRAACGETGRAIRSSADHAWRLPRWEKPSKGHTPREPRPGHAHVQMPVRKAAKPCARAPASLPNRDRIDARCPCAWFSVRFGKSSRQSCGRERIPRSPGTPQGADLREPGPSEEECTAARSGRTDFAGLSRRFDRTGDSRCTGPAPTGTADRQELAG